MKSRGYIVTVIVIVLLIWGPINDSWPASLAIRIGYLILIPLLVSFALRWIWKIWNPDAASENRLERALFGATAGIFLIFAIMKSMAKTHIGNTDWVRTHDGMEAVGDDVILPGPDWGVVAMLGCVSGIAFWQSVTKANESE